ncbi:MAG: hypothetical protein JST92_20495 [Deltaproteobacteria bacterium]|nr:hypothetical protein [Deltaproteobacteria bacterium]
MRKVDLAAFALLLALGTAEGTALILTPSRQGQPVIHDEFAYLLQAKMLASGHVSMPSPELPEFFEAAHVLVVPRYAAKYLPGHALYLMPFVILGVPWLGPALGLGLFCALLYCAARALGLHRAAAGAAGLLPLLSDNLAPVFGRYLSWTSALPLIAASIACAALALRTRRAPWLAGLSALAGWLFWDRPFAGLAMMITLGAATLVGLRETAEVRLDRRARLRWLLAAAAPLALWGLLTLAVCKDVTGRFTELPWATYARQYLPGDGPGFGPGAPPAPERAVPAHDRRTFEAMEQGRRAFTPQVALAALPQRLAVIASFEPTRLLWPLALLGLVLSRALWLPVGLFGLTFFCLQSTFHFRIAMYMLEAAPPLVLSLAAGLEGLARLSQRPPQRALRLLTTSLCSLPALLLLTEGAQWLSRLQTRGHEPPVLTVAVEAALAPLRSQHALVFLRYPADRDLNSDFGYNDPDLVHTPLLRALDRGPRNAELMALHPDRPAYLLDVVTARVTPLPR